MKIKEIESKLKSKVEFIIGLPVRGLLKNIVLVLSSMFKSLETKIEYIRKNAYVLTADYEHLILLSGNIKKIKEATSSKVSLILSGVNNTIISKGVSLLDDYGNKYIIQNEGIITQYIYENEIINPEYDEAEDYIYSINTKLLSLPTIPIKVNNIDKIGVNDGTRFFFSKDGISIQNGVVEPLSITIYYGNVEAESTTKGSLQILGFNETLSLSRDIEGLDTISRVITYFPGREKQSIEEFRNDVIDFLYKPQASFSKNEIEFLIKENNANIKFIYIKAVNYKVYVYLCDYDYKLDDITKLKINDLILSIAPANFHKEDLFIQLPIIKKVNVKFTNFTPNEEEFIENVTNNIKSFFDSDLFERDITKRDYEDILYNSQFGLTKIQTFEISKESIINKEENTLFILGDVNYFE